MTANRTPGKIIPRAFPGIKAAEVEELIASSQVHAYPPGTILCREKAVEDTFYIILEGEAEVTKLINDIEARRLKTLGPGDFFGEMAIIHNAPRAATVKAKTHLVVLETRREAFDRVLQRSSSVSLAMVREISRRLRENDEMAIDDLRLRARELAEAYQKLAEQDLARRDFLTNIAHHLRTPLTSASGYLHLLQKGAVPPEQTRAILETVSRNVGQINTLVNDILFVQEMELIMGKFQAVDMGKMAASVVEGYREKAAARTVALRLLPDPDLPPAAGDPRHLERALTALVDNAVKFSPQGGEVTITLGLRDDQVTISVRDQGIGIEADQLPKIFDRFYHLDTSGDRLFEGIGLGLAVTRQVLEQHNGKLDVESAPGKGSTFTMRLNRWTGDEAITETGVFKKALLHEGEL